MPKSKNLSMAELDERLEAMITSKLSSLQEDNEKLRLENASLREAHEQLLDRLNLLIDAIQKNGPPAAAVPAESSDEPDEPEALNYEPTPAVSSSPPESFSTKSHTLILSDSIFRHVLTSCPKQPGNRAPIIDKFSLDSKGDHTIYKMIVPGADAARLWEAASSIPDRHSFSNVIVSVGANHTSAQPPDIASYEIEDFLTAITKLFPTAQVSWSVLLPQPDKLPGIRHLNNYVSSFCHENNIELIWAQDFSVIFNGPEYVRSLFARDGVHLNRKGIELMTAAVKHYIFSLYKY